MRRKRPSPWRRLTELWRTTPSRRKFASYVLEYAALRTWSLVINCFPIDTNLRSARLMGNIWWLLMKRHRDRAMEQLLPSLGDRYSEDQLRRIARRCFVHFAQLYLVELLMAPRLITHWSWARYATLHKLDAALRELLSGRGAIMLTAHFGNFEVLGFLLAKLGLPQSAVMRPLDNTLVNDMLLEARESSGLSLLYKKGASESADDILADGGVLSFIADQDAGRKGVFADFFGRKASWYKSIGLLAMRHRVPLIVGYAVREKPGFHYGIHVERIIQPEEWEGRDAPLEWITQTFSHAIEAGIRRHPEQYLWIHRRWKSRPREERA